VLPLVVVRGWEAHDESRFPGFLEQLRHAGVDVVDLYQPAGDARTMGEWAARLVDELPAGGPQRLLGYSLGGHLVLAMTAILADRGEAPGYVGLVDTWLRSPQYSMLAGVYWRFGVGWRRRVRHQLLSLARPDPVPVSVMVQDAARRFARTLLSIRKKGLMTRRRPRIPNWDGQHLMYEWAFPPLDVPVHLYNAVGTIEQNGNDPSMGLAPHLRAGYVLRTMAGDHHTCLAPPNRELLTEAVVADLAAPTTVVRL